MRLLECGPMSAPTATPWPRFLSDLPPVNAAPADNELAALQALQHAGVPIAPMVVVPAEVEERFYRLNTLPERFLDLFEGVDPTDPDEDDLDEIAPAAQALVERHYLLDEFVDTFYDRIERLPARLRVRRPFHEGRVATRGRPALLALKRVWSDDWTFEALVARLERTHTLELEARPVLVHEADRRAEASLRKRVERALDTVVEPWCSAGGAVTRVVFGADDAYTGNASA